MTVSQHRRPSRQRAGHLPALALAMLGLLQGTPAAAAPAGLGQVRLQSHVGQPLRAEIDIAGLTPADSSAIQVALAAPQAYAAAGLTYPAALAGAQWRLQRQADGSYVAHLTSEAPVAEPFVELLVEMRWPGGRATRAYTVLLDGGDAAAPATPEGATAPMIVRPEPAGDDAAGVRPGSASPADASGIARESAGHARAYTVRRGDHLYRIAESLVSGNDAVSLDQMVVALFRANPRAFIGGNMNRLKAGAVLKLPEEAEASAIAPRDARRELVAHTRGFDAYRNRLADAAAAAVATRGDGQQQAGRITARVDDTGGPAAGPRDELTLSKPPSPSSRSGAVPEGDAEANVARERQLREAEQRLAQLRKNVDDIERLLELKSAEMARLGEQGGQGASDGAGTGGAPALPGGPSATGDVAGMNEGRPAGAADDGLAGPYVLPVAGAVLALLAGYGLYRRQRSGPAHGDPAGPGVEAPDGPLVFGDLTLPLEAFPDAGSDPGKPARSHGAAVAGAAASSVWPEHGHGMAVDENGSDPDSEPDTASQHAFAQRPPPPAFDFGGISLDLDAGDARPSQDADADAGAPKPPRDGRPGGERA